MHALSSKYRKSKDRPRKRRAAAKAKRRKKIKQMIPYIIFLHVSLKQCKEDQEHTHEHGHHGHTHEHLDSPGAFISRQLPLFRKDFDKRAFTVGIGGPVGSGKTALVLALSKYLREKHNLCIVTNDIFTREDWEFLVKNEALLQIELEL
ncbi:uncharacterized urease accessory protein ureG-like [Caerostris extrusa]|uniref:Uncharacterized urease accessory protein ureG-like n=1 Tax=Caerostris extrusa TaxID=172846 RepID=A0AAV4SEW5_CAEEX|nr:uncharacterized urease accessory protein ureG-like [Caerostris extrusa]